MKSDSNNSDLYLPGKTHEHHLPHQQGQPNQHPLQILRQKKLSNFVLPVWKLHNQYYHNG